MKSLSKLIFKILCFFFFAAFLISCFTQYIPPSRFSYVTLFCLAFPYLFLLMLIFTAVCFFINRRIAFLSLLFLLLGFKNLQSTIAFNFPSKWNAEKKDSSLRIMTWNVEDFVNLLEGSPVRAKMLNLITQNNPDILCLQEFTNVEGGKWRVSVRRELDSMGYKFHYSSTDQRWSSAVDRVTIRGTVIFSKQPFTDTSGFTIRKDIMHESAIYATFILNNKPLRIYTTHLASFQFYRDTVNENKDIYQITYDRKRAIQYKLREIEQLHEQEVKVIRDSIAKSPYPVIYCGDMNTTPCSYNYRILKNNLQDAFLAKGSGIGATFYKILPTLRIDVCLADKAFNINQCTVIPKKLSDHYPVITDISWK